MRKHTGFNTKYIFCNAEQATKLQAAAFCIVNQTFPVSEMFKPVRSHRKVIAKQLTNEGRVDKKLVEKVLNKKNIKRKSTQVTT